MKVALVYNLIRPELVENRRLDEIAELDCEETIKALEDALTSSGHKPVLLEATENIFRDSSRAQERT